MADTQPDQTDQDRPVGRAERRRRQTYEEILDAALTVVTEDGVAALNMSQVARRVGMRQPSLYQYFASRLAMYDGLFQRGMQGHLALVRAAVRNNSPGMPTVRAIAEATVRFTAENPALAQLIFMPAVPGFEPTPEAYAPSLQVHQHLNDAVSAAVDGGELRPEATSDHALAVLVSLTAGIAARHVGNNQHDLSNESLYLPLITLAVDMWAAWYAPPAPTSRPTEV